MDSGEPDDPVALAARLDAGYRSWLEGLDADQRNAILAWQGADRHYDLIQSAFRRSSRVSDEIQDEIESLDQLLRHAQLPFAVTGWKGLRSVATAFGIPTAELGPGAEVRYQGFFALTIDRDVATPEFTHPPGLPAAGVLRMEWPAGARLGWIAGVGDPSLRHQYELLARPGLRLRVLEVTYPRGDGSIPEISVEVSPR